MNQLNISEEVKENIILSAKKIAEDIASFYGLNVDVAVHLDGNILDVLFPSTYMNSQLIGRNGEVLNNLQHLISTMVHKANSIDEYDNESRIHVHVDIGDYKKKLREELEVKARSWANKVIETKEEMRLQPMNSMQRLIVHNVISEEFKDELTSESDGFGRDRAIILKFLA
jgi:spoIIIJ-associated protein